MPEPQSTDLNPEIRRIVDAARGVESDGLLRTDEEFIRDIFEVLPFQRLGGRIRERLLTVAQGARRRQNVPQG